MRGSVKQRYIGKSFKESLVKGKYTVDGEKPHPSKLGGRFGFGHKIHNQVIC